MAGTTRFLRSCSIIQRILDVVLKRSRIFLETKRLTVSRFNEKDPFSARKLELCPLETKRRDHSTSLSTDTVLCQQFRPWKPINRQTERERETITTEKHRTVSNRKLTAKIHRPQPSFTTPLRNRDHRCRIRIPSVAGGYLCVLPYLSNRLPRPFTPLCMQEERGGARSRDNLTTSERCDGSRGCLQRSERRDAQTLEETGCDTWIKHWQTLADSTTGFGEWPRIRWIRWWLGWEGRLGEGNWGIRCLILVARTARMLGASEPRRSARAPSYWRWRRPRPDWRNDPLCGVAVAQ